MIAVGYARRSKESSVRSVSLDDQRQRIAGYCAAQGWELADILIDDGVSGGRRERLNRIAARVDGTGARAVVVYHLDRFARDVAALLDSVRGFSRRGIELHVVGRGRIEIESASGFLVTGVEGPMAEHYRRLIGEKTRDALARLRAKGRRISRWAPYGFTFGPGGRVVDEPIEQAACRRILALAGGGVSLRTLSRVLAEEGIVARSGRPFGPTMLSRIVHNPSLVNAADPS